MEKRIFTYIAILTLVFSACNSANNSANIETPHKSYNIEYYPELDSLGVVFKAKLMLPLNNDNISTTIRKELLHTICGPSYNNETEAQEAMENLNKNLNNEWAKMYNPNDEYSMPMLWELKTECIPIAEVEDFSNYKISTYYYTGGAHGLSVINYVVFHKETAQRLTDRDIYKPDVENKVTQLLIEEYAQRCAQDIELANNKMDEPTLNSNFTITPDSIIYLYNQYDIASYAQGVVELGLSKEEVAPYINPTSPLALYWDIKQ